MDRPRPVLVVAKGLQRQREEMRLLLGEHGGDLALGGSVDAGVGPARLPAIEIRLSLPVEPLEAQALERRLLRVPDGRLDFALAIWIPDPTGQRHGAVVGEHIAVQWVERGIVDVRREHALLEVIEHDDADGAAETTKRLFVELRPAPGARVEGEQADALAAVAEGEDEQARAAVLPRDGVPDHRAVAVIDLPLLAGRGHDHRMRLEGALTTQPPHEAPHAGVPGWEPVLIDQVLPDRHGVAAATEGELDELAVGLAGARPGGPAGRRRPRRQPAEGRRPHAKVGGHLTGRFCWVGGHLTGRFWRRPPAAGPADRDPSGLEIGARRLATDPDRLFDAAERPSQPPQSEDLLLLVVSQDVRHPGGDPQSPPPRQRPGVALPHWPVFRRPRLAGFGCPPRMSGTRFSAELCLKDDILVFRLSGTIKSGSVEVIADRLHSDDIQRKLRGTHRRLQWTNAPQGRETILLTEVGHPEGLTIGAPHQAPGAPPKGVPAPPARAPLAG